MKLSRLCLPLVFALVAFAAGAEPPSDDQWVEHLKKKLNLTEQQVGEVKKIQEETKAEREALRQQHEALHKKVAEKLKGVLTDEQRQKFEAMHQGRMQHGGKRGMGGMHGGGMEEGCPMMGEGGEMSGCPGHGQGPAAGGPRPGQGAKAKTPAAPAEKQ